MILYGEDLAHAHNVGFADYSLNAGAGILNIFAKAGLHGGTVVDLGCGGGQWLRMLSDAGYDALGVDSSRAFVRMAKREAPQARVRLGSLWECDLPRCDAVTALGEVLSYLPPGPSRPPSLRKFFSYVHSILRKDGLFVFDMLTASKQKPMSYRTWRAGEEWAVLVDVKEEAQKARCYRSITTFRMLGGTFRQNIERHALRVVSRSEIVSLLRDLGFAVRTASRYCDFELPPRRTVFRARRR